MYRKFQVSIYYTEHAGLGIPVDLYIRLRPWKSEMLVPNCIGAYGRKAVLQPSLVSGTSLQRMRVMMGTYGPRANFFSLTVCKLEQYLKSYSENAVDSHRHILKQDQHCRLLFAVKTATRCTKSREIWDPHTPYSMRDIDV